jgi:protein-tyrosine phosphatase
MSFDWVYENLYVGGLAALDHQDEVREEGISAIVRLDTYERENGQWDDDFALLDMPFLDGDSIPDDIIPEVTSFIHARIQAEKSVLVHCAVGMSRSVTMAMAYLIEYEGMSLAEAFGTVREGRNEVYPHENLLISLIEHYDLPYDTARVQNPGFLAELMNDV